MQYKRNTNNKYCNNKCQQGYQYKVKVQKWLSGSGTIGKNPLRRYITERDGYECYECGIDSWLGKDIVLEIEHVDGDAYNNQESNLKFICPNCHSQTNSYKNRNKGKGRELNKGKGWLLEKQSL
jgi:5-methylcytosine-specific restriction endonuclease McrA